MQNNGLSRYLRLGKESVDKIIRRFARGRGFQKFRLERGGFGAKGPRLGVSSAT